MDVPVSQNIITDVSGDASEALSQALHEKVVSLFSLFTHSCLELWHVGLLIWLQWYFCLFYKQIIIDDGRSPGCSSKA